MSRIRSVAAMMVAFFLVSCDRSSDPDIERDSADGSKSTDGWVTLRLKSGPAGVLARSASSNSSPTTVSLSLQKKSPYGYWETVKFDTYPLTGTGDLTLYYPVPIEGEWRFYGIGLDENGFQVVEGVAEFSVAAGQNKEVSLLMGPFRSSAHLKLPILDSMTRFVVNVGGVSIESTVVKQTRVGDTIRIDLDDLPASAEGQVTQVSLRVYGEYWDREYTMFALDDTIRVVSGVSRPLALNMAWVGPNEPPPTLVRLGLTLGEAGHLAMQTAYQAHDQLGEGSVFDWRTGQTYWYKRFGSQVWMTRNIGDACYSDTCRQGRMFIDSEADMLPYIPGGDIYARGDTGADYRTACPVGWHVPDTSEWRTLVRFAANGATDSVGAYHLRSLTAWTGVSRVVYIPTLGGWMPGPVAMNGDDVLGFGLFPTFRYFSNGAYLDVPEAELWTSTPGVPVAHFDYQGNFHLESHFRESYTFYSIVEHRNAAVRCLQD